MHSETVEFHSEPTTAPRRRQPRRRSVGDIPSDHRERERIIAEAKWLKELREERAALLKETSLVKDICRSCAPTRRMSTGDVPNSKSIILDAEQRRIKEDLWMKKLTEERTSMLQETSLHPGKAHDTIVENEHYKYFSQAWIAPGPQ
eukprot:CAMPEP_0194204708 /NCGR_PEP_ID=MMETSP0156-20130528/4158_1 /TAXON_ID=33649 /ORGANISM="Thalassionema nitzschioides, Strain L26-B" /LENGTH=146 /DNA_ID=CAMNT_0038930795 /DNA_START=193 /DNA_END=633 /DNA_ORIENTATION=+